MMMTTGDAIPNPRHTSGVSLFGKLRTTPLQDLLRGQLTARLHYRHIVHTSDLPGVLKHLVVDVARRTRLWRGEKVDVARELIAHFQDGLHAGRSPDELADDFGAPGTAASLIRRAKKRQRPAWWQACRYSLRAAFVFIGLLLIAYLYFAIPYWTASPEPKVDYVAQLNAAATATDPHDRAWPLYQQAITMLPDASDVGALVSRPGGENWPAYEALLEANQDALQLAREAAERPALGFIVTTPPGDDLLEGSLFSISLPYLGPLRRLAMLMLDDARRLAASSESPSADVTERLTASLRIAAHTREIEVLIGDLVAGAILVATLDAVDELLAQNPTVLSDEDLQRLAHEISAFGGGDPRPRVDAERLAFDDLLQRIYTDDGAGGGHLTSTGGEAMMLMTTLGGTDPDPLDIITATFDPFLMTIVADRRAMRRKFDEMMGLLLAEAAQPAWERAKTPSIFGREIEAMHASSVDRLRFLPIVLLMPALDRMIESGDLIVQQRDATLTAIALELYRRLHGRWPDSLEALVPSLLPSLPLDQYTGQPLRYLLRDGGPILYSIGSDGIDHGGEPPRDLSGRPRIEYARGRAGRTIMSVAEPQGITPGDWILWPPVDTAD